MPSAKRRFPSSSPNLHMLFLWQHRPPLCQADVGLAMHFGAILFHLACPRLSHNTRQNAGHSWQLLIARIPC